MKRPKAKYNLDIRAAAKANGVYLWEIAEKLDVSEPTFNRYLRKELPATMKQNILTAIEQIKSEHDGQAQGESS